MKSHLYDCEHCGRADRGMDAEGNNEYYCDDKYNGVCHYEGINAHWIVECIPEIGKKVKCSECEEMILNPHKLYKYCPNCGQLINGRYKYV